MIIFLIPFITNVQWFCCSVFAVSLKCIYQLVENLGWFFQSILFAIKRLASKVAKPESSSGLKDLFVYDIGKHNFTFFPYSTFISFHCVLGGFAIWVCIFITEAFKDDGFLWAEVGLAKYLICIICLTLSWFCEMFVFLAAFKRAGNWDLENRSNLLMSYSPLEAVEPCS